MYKVLALIGIGIGLMFAAPLSAQALPGTATAMKTASALEQVGYKHRHRHYKHRYYKHRYWKRGHGHHHHRYYRKRKGIHIHVN